MSSLIGKPEAWGTVSARGWCCEMPQPHERQRWRYTTLDIWDRDPGFSFAARLKYGVSQSRRDLDMFGIGVGIPQMTQRGRDHVADSRASPTWGKSSCRAPKPHLNSSVKAHSKNIPNRVLEGVASLDCELETRLGCRAAESKKCKADLLRKGLPNLRQQYLHGRPDRHTSPINLRQRRLTPFRHNHGCCQPPEPSITSGRFEWC
ncbi:hypothetical protein QBC36DRAFT_64173 [Triangularia setosa]|uniref:Uncharacterized protein n=1 Tax=Triangularia setosa TaxID=2587417 RepID=A0AAN6W196_9PEZI|nr:hypothetical protein QBC36DRAFT_64173 [Podospora setosa]